MTKQELMDVADDFLSSNEEPDWEVDLRDRVALVFTDITEDSKCLVVYANSLSGELDDAEIFTNEEEAEAHLNALQAETYETEEEDVDV
jgi:hypothetical protein